MEEMSEKIQKAVVEAKSFAIISEKGAAEHIFLLKEAFVFHLYQKNFPVIALPQAPERFLKKWGSILGAHSEVPKRKTLIRIPKEQCRVKEVSYEDNENSLTIIVSPREGRLAKEALIIEEMPFETEIIICFSGNRELLSSCSGQVVIPSEDRIIYITKNEQLATEKIHNLINLSGNLEISPFLATLLLAALVKETACFSQPSLQEKNFSLAARFLKAGADKEKINAILGGEKDASFFQILGRALSRTRNNDILKSSWTFLTSQDFEKTKNIPSLELLEKIATEIRNHVPRQPLQLILWQEPELAGEFRAFIFSEEEKKLLSLADRLGVQTKSAFIVTNSFASFSEAEIRIRQLLKGFI